MPLTEIKTEDKDIITVDTYQLDWLETEWGNGRSRYGKNSHVSCSINRYSTSAAEHIMARLTPSEARAIAVALFACAEKLEPLTADAIPLVIEATA